MKKAVRALALLGLLLGAQGCGTSGEVVAESGAAGCGSTPPEGVRGELSPAVTRAALLPLEYVPVAGPQALFDLVDLVADGRVVAIADGREIGARDHGPHHKFVVTIRPEKVYKAPGGEVPTLVHIEFYRPVTTPASAFREAIPDRTRVVMFGYRLKETTEEAVRNQFGGRAEGSPLYTPSPQGLFLDVDRETLPPGLTHPDLGINGFSDLSEFDEIAADPGC